MNFFSMRIFKIEHFKYFFSLALVFAFATHGFAQGNNPTVEQLKNAYRLQTGAERIKTLYELSYLLSGSDLEQAFYYDSLALETAFEIKDTTWQVKVLTDLSYLFSRKFDYSNAKILLDKASGLGKEKKLNRELYIVYTALGNYFFNLNLYDSALYYHHQSLNIKERLGDKSITATTLNNIGMIYFRIQSYNNALDYFNTSLTVNLQAGDSIAASANYNNIGLIYIEVGEFGLAKINFTKALEILENENNIRLSTTYNGLGQVYLNFDDFENARKYFFKAIETSRKFYDKKNESYSYHYLAKLELNKGAYKAAKRYIQKSQQLLEKIGDDLRITYNFKLLAQLYEATGQFDSAYYYHKEYSLIESSIFNEHLNNNLANLQLLRQAEESQQIIAQKELDITQRTKLSRMLAVVLALSILLIIIVSRNYVNSSRINKKLSDSNAKIEKQKEDLERKNKQLADAQQTIEIQNERLRNVNSELEAAVKSRTKELERSKIKLEKAVKDLDDFIYRTSHDLRGPIATMQGIIKVGTMESRDEETLKYFETLQTISSRANRILNKLIEMHEMYQRSAEIEIVNVERCVKAAAELAGKSELAKGIDIHYEVDKNVEWLCDKSLLVSIIENMMINAFLFSINKESFVKLKVFKNPTSHLKIQFEDNGYGILESDVNKVFDVFFKGSPRRSGTGLEIYSARIAVEKLKGNIELKKPKDNTIYEITLPVL